MYSLSGLIDDPTKLPKWNFVGSWISPIFYICSAYYHFYALQGSCLPECIPCCCIAFFFVLPVIIRLYRPKKSVWNYSHTHDMLDDQCSQSHWMEFLQLLIILVQPIGSSQFLIASSRYICLLRLALTLPCISVHTGVLVRCTRCLSMNTQRIKIKLDFQNLLRPSCALTIGTLFTLFCAALLIPYYCHHFSG